MTAMDLGPLAAFKVADLAAYTKEGPGGIPADATHWMFDVGYDDVHNVLLSLLNAVKVRSTGNMFGYDDEELDASIWKSCMDSSIRTFWTLDRSQAGGVHEKKILDAHRQQDLADFNAHFAIITSSTSQISHTKGGVLDGYVAFEGSTNWSTSGEGTFLPGHTDPGGSGYKAQNNTLLVTTFLPVVSRFEATLMAEHLSAHVAGGSLTATPAT